MWMWHVAKTASSLACHYRPLRPCWYRQTVRMARCNPNTHAFSRPTSWKGSRRCLCYWYGRVSLGPRSGPEIRRCDRLRCRNFCWEVHLFSPASTHLHISRPKKISQTSSFTQTCTPYLCTTKNRNLDGRVAYTSRTSLDKNGLRVISAHIPERISV